MRRQNGRPVAILVGKLVQHGSPLEILSNPANDFVCDFIGYDRVVKKLSLCRAGSIYERLCLLGKRTPAAKDGNGRSLFLVDSKGFPGYADG